MDRKKELRGHLLAIVTIFIWGTTFISTKILLETFSPIEILFIRIMLAFVVLLMVFPHRLKLKDRKQELYFMAAGLCGVTLYYLLENIALTYTLASNVGVIVSLSPFFTAILAHWFLDGEKLRVQFFVGFVVAVLGISLISFNSISNLRINPTGDILAVLAAAAWSAYSIFTKKISGFRYNTIQSTRRIFFYGLLFMIPTLFIFGFKPDINQIFRPINLFNFIFLGAGASALCFVTWNLAVKKLGAIKTSVYIYMVPVIAVVTATLVLGEPITWIAVVGILLTLAGLFISEMKVFAKKKERS